MIEQIMFFALGALVATLVALLVLPAVWHRAVRLTTRRIEAAVPVSIFEIQADKDQQRAAFALNQRRLEFQLDQVRETLVGQARTIEQQRLKVVALERSLAEKTGEHEALTAVHGALQARFDAEAAALAERTSSLERTQAQLAAASADLAATREALAERSAQADTLQVTLADREAVLSLREGQIAELERELAHERAAHAFTSGQLGETRTQLAASQVAAAEADAKAVAHATSLTTDLAAIRRTLIDTTAQNEARAKTIAEHETRIAELDTALANALSDLEASRSGLHAFSVRRAEEFSAAEAKAQSLSQTLDMLKADHAMMTDALERARAARGSALDANALAALKETIGDLAAELAGRAAREPGSPLPAILAQPEAAAGTAPTLGARIIRRAARGEPSQPPAEAPAALPRQAAGE